MKRPYQDLSTKDLKKLQKKTLKSFLKEFQVNKEPSLRKLSELWKEERWRTFFA